MNKPSPFHQPERLRTEFTREGGYYVLVLAFVLTGAMLRDINLMMLIAGIMAGLWIYNWRKATSTLRRLAVRRSCPETICAGDVLVVEVAASNLSRRRNKHGVRVEDTVRQLVGKKAAQTSTGSVVFERIAAGRTQTQSYQGRVWTRGHYELGPLEVSCRYPFGLMRRRGPIDDLHRLTVYPRLGRLTPAWARLHEEAHVGAQRLRRQQTRTQGDFYGLRDWREGDSHRWIHWRTSARRGKLVVRQYERQRRQDVMLFVDLWQPKIPTDAQTDAVELAVSFAATIVADLCRRGGSQLHLLVGGRERQALGGAASQGLLTEMMAALAVCQASPAEVLAEMLVEGLTSAPRHCKLLLISTRAIEITSIAAQMDLPEDTVHRISSMRPLTFDTSTRQIDEYFTLD